MWSLGEDLDVAGGGGNVNAVRGGLDLTFEDLLRGECIKYGDFTSLYPTCMITKDMCVGKPHVIEYGDIQPTPRKLKTFFGLITCDVQPPTTLFHPVLLRNEDGFLIDSLLPIRNRTHTSVELQLAMEKDTL